MRQPGDSSRRGGRDTVRRGLQMRPMERTAYIKGKADAQKLEPVKVVVGLSDGSWSEVLSSNPPLHAGDSVAIGSFTPSATAQPQGTSPVSTPGGGMRGFGGAGGGGARGGGVR
jgi:hypothetical protein